MTAHAGIYKTYAIFNIYVFCGDYCEECSVENTCDICEKGYELDNSLQCVPIVDDAISSGAYGIAAQVMAYTLLALGGLSLSINPNFWTLVNAMQIMRTITLLKINMPLRIRSIIWEATELGGLDISFNIFDIKTKEENKVKWAIENDPTLVKYYEDYGIEEYKHWSYIKS